MHTSMPSDTAHSGPERSLSLIISTLAAHPLFGTLPPESLTALAERAQINTSPKEQIIFLQDETAERVYFVKQGWVKLFRETIDGSEAVIDVLSVGSLFGETAQFNDKKYPYSAQMAEDGAYISIPLSFFEHLLNTNQGFSQALLHILAKSGRHQDQELEHRTLQNTAQRIGCFILRLCNYNTKGPQTINLPYDKTLIAAKLGMQPETFSRGLSRLHIDTNLLIQGSTITVSDISVLRNYCCGLCSNAYPCKDLI